MGIDGWFVVLFCFCFCDRKKVICFCQELKFMGTDGFFEYIGLMRMGKFSGTIE